MLKAGYRFAVVTIQEIPMILSSRTPSILRLNAVIIEVLVATVKTLQANDRFTIITIQEIPTVLSSRTPSVFRLNIRSIKILVATIKMLQTTKRNTIRAKIIPVILIQSCLPASLFHTINKSIKFIANGIKTSGSYVIDVVLTINPTVFYYRSSLCLHRIGYFLLVSFILCWLC